MKIFIFFIALFGVVLCPAAVSAQDIGTGLVKRAAEGAGYSSETTETSFAATLGSIVKIILSFVGVIFLSLMIYAGLLWMTAQGDDTKIDKAQKIIRSAIIGLILTISAYSITNFVVPKIVGRAAEAPSARTP